MVAPTRTLLGPTLSQSLRLIDAPMSLPYFPAFLELSLSVFYFCEKLGWIGFRQSCYVLLFHEVNILPRRYLLLRVYGRYGRSRDAAKVTLQRPSKGGINRPGAHHAPLRASLGSGAPTSGVGRHPGRTYVPVFVSCVVNAHPPALQRGLHRVVFRTPCPVCIVPLPRWRWSSLVLMLTVCSHAALSLD